MDARIRHEHIANEAYRVQQILNRYDSDANWYEAIDNLSIFPNRTYYIHRISGDSVDDGFGLIYNSFGYQNLLWHRCREVFERNIFFPRTYYDNFMFGFFLSPTMRDQEYRVANFIRNVELDRLNLGELTTFMRVGGRHYIYVRPSSFWTSCRMRFSLFTVLVRAGRHYHFNTIEDALMIEPYARQTFSAINLFFKGRQNFIGTIENWQSKWVSHFRDLHESQIHELV